MSDLKKYVVERKERDRKFAEGFDEGYAQFKIGVTLRKAREAAGLSQEELANSPENQEDGNLADREPRRGHKALDS